MRVALEIGLIGFGVACAALAIDNALLPLPVEGLAVGGAFAAIFGVCCSIFFRRRR